MSQATLSPARVILELARHELHILLHTRRAVGLLALTAAISVLGGGTYVYTVRTIESELAKAIESRGSSDVVVNTLDTDGYRQMLAFISDVGIEDMAPFLVDSAVLPVVLWASLFILPMLILMMSFDLMTAELQMRSIRYSILRARRSEIVLGKALGHWILFAALALVNATVVVAIGDRGLDSVHFLHELPGLLALWVLLLPMGACYIGICSLASTLTQRPFGALFLASGILMGLRVLGVMRHATGDWAWIRHAAWLSPTQYNAGYWYGGILQPAGSAIAYGCFGALFLGLTVWRLAHRDL